MAERTSEEKKAIVGRVRRFMGKRGASRRAPVGRERAGPPVPPGGTVGEDVLQRLEREGGERHE